MQNMIGCTGVDAMLKVTPFQSEAEKITGYILGAADLVGQMAADDYIEKLPVFTRNSPRRRTTAAEIRLCEHVFQRPGLAGQTPNFWRNTSSPSWTAIWAGRSATCASPCPTARISTWTKSRPTSGGCARCFPRKTTPPCS